MHGKIIKGGLEMNMRIALLVLMVVAMFAMNQTDVFADVPESERPVTSEYIRQSNGLDEVFSPLLSFFVTSASSGSPSDCSQSAYEPVKWGNSNNVRGKITATCKQNVPEMHHTAELLRWQGFTGGGWQAIGQVGVFHGTNARSGSAYGTTTCTKHNFKVTGEGYVVDVDDVKYLTGTTSRIAENPCGLD